MSRRLRATGAGDGQQGLRKNGSANKLLRGRGSSASRAAAAGAARRAVRARVRGCWRGRRRVVGGGARVPRAARRRRRFAGAERGSRLLQVGARLDTRPRDPFRVLASPRPPGSIVSGCAPPNTRRAIRSRPRRRHGSPDPAVNYKYMTSTPREAYLLPRWDGLDLELAQVGRS